MSGLGHLQGGDAGCALLGGVQWDLAGLAVLFDGDGALFVGGQPVANEAVVERRRVLVDQLVSFIIRDGDMDVFLAELTSAGGQGVVEAVMGLGHVRRDGDVELVLRQRQGGLTLFSSEDELVRAHGCEEIAIALVLGLAVQLVHDFLAIQPFEIELGEDLLGRHLLDVSAGSGAFRGFTRYGAVSRARGQGDGCGAGGSKRNEAFHKSSE